MGETRYNAHMERLRSYIKNEYNKPTPPGMFEPLDRLNNVTKRVQRDAAVVFTATAVALPFTAPITIPLAEITALGSIGDHIQGDLSQTAAQELGIKKSQPIEMKPGKEYRLAKAA